MGCDYYIDKSIVFTYYIDGKKYTDSLEIEREKRWVYCDEDDDYEKELEESMKENTKQKNYSAEKCPKHFIDMIHAFIKNNRRELFSISSFPDELIISNEDIKTFVNLSNKIYGGNKTFNSVIADINSINSKLKFEKAFSEFFVLADVEYHKTCTERN